MAGYPNQPSLYRVSDRPNMLHNQACNFSFADGHAETHRWLDPSTMPPLNQLPPEPWAPGDPDVAWLQDHATSPK
jgi:prepilin-type processing-associated H-X9-DG protein